MKSSQFVLPVPLAVRPTVAFFALAADAAPIQDALRLFGAPRRQLLAIMITFAVLTGMNGNLAAQMQTMVSSGDFVGWTAPASFVFPNQGASATANFVSSGGNPGAAVDIGLSYPETGPGVSHFAAQVIINASVSWVPPVQGEIVALGMSVDEAALVSEADGQVVRIVVEQGGYLYLSTPFALTYDLATWETLVVTAGPMSAWARLGSQGLANAVIASPDFSSAGGLMRFGVDFALSDGPGAPQRSRTHRYDNWSLTIQYLVPAPMLAYPGTGEDFSLGTSVTGTACTSGPGEDQKTVPAGGFLSLCLSTPGGSFLGHPLLVVAQLAPTGTSLANSLPLPLERLWVFPFVIIIDGVSTAGPLGPSHILGPIPSVYNFQVPSQLTGQQIALQAALITPMAQNGLVVLSEAHVILVQ